MQLPARRSFALVVVAVAAAAALVSPASARTPTADRMRTFTPVALHASSATSSGSEAAARPVLRPSSAAAGRATWPAAAPATTQTAAPATTFGFDAIPRIGGHWPADPTGAIGLAHYFTAVNTHLAVYDLTGAEVLGPQSLEGLFALPIGTQVFDPKIVYDQYRDTFVLAFLGVNDGQQKSWILVVTIPDATADDMSTWCGSKIGGDRTTGDGKQWPDFPGLGFSLDRIAITANRFDFADGGFDSAQILSFPKSSLYDCASRLRFATFLGSDTSNPDGSPAFTVQPAVSAGKNPNAQYLVSIEDEKIDYLVVWRLRLVGGEPTLKRARIDIPRFAIGPYGTQCGGSLNGSNTWWDPGDTRLVTAFFDADLDRLYTAHAAAKDLGPDPQTGGYVESVVRWYEVRTDPELGSSELARRGVVGQPESDAGWPALGTDSQGNLWITYSQASQPNGECLSAWAAQVEPGKIGASRLLLAEGEARFEALRGVERWGDFNAVSRDPADGAFVAMVNQYALADGGASTMDWQQTVAVVSAG
jgi:hypothetical protein